MGERGQSIYVEVEGDTRRLKLEYRNTNSRKSEPTIRTRFYGVRYNTDVETWKHERLNTPYGQKTTSGYDGLQNPDNPEQYWWNGQWWDNAGKTQASIDHRHTVVDHWNEQGNNQTQNERYAFFRTIANLDIKPRRFNSKEGRERARNKKYSIEVGPNFRGPSEK